MTASRSGEATAARPPTVRTGFAAGRRRCGRPLAARIGTVRAVAAAAGAWAGVTGAGRLTVAAGLCCALVGAVLVLAERSRGSSAPAAPAARAVAGGLLAALGLSVLVASAHALSIDEAPRPESAVVHLVTDPQETASGRFRSVATGEIGRVTVVADEPAPPAGSRIRAQLDWWDDDLAGLERAEVLGPPGERWRLRAGLRAGLVDVSGAGAHAGADLLPGLAVGDVSRLDEDLAEAMRTVSLTHLTAVSGDTVRICGGSCPCARRRLTDPDYSTAGSAASDGICAKEIVRTGA